MQTHQESSAEERGTFRAMPQMRLLSRIGSLDSTRRRSVGRDGEVLPFDSRMELLDSTQRSPVAKSRRMLHCYAGMESGAQPSAGWLVRSDGCCPLATKWNCLTQPNAYLLARSDGCRLQDWDGTWDSTQHRFARKLNGCCPLRKQLKFSCRIPWEMGARAAGAGQEVDGSGCCRAINPLCGASAARRARRHQEVPTKRHPSALTQINL